MSKNFRFRIAVFFFTLSLSLITVFAHYVYVNRQGIFNNAAWNGNVKLMELASLLGVDVNAPSCEFQTCPAPIVFAAWYGHNKAVLYLLDHGADINNSGNWAMTALMMASFNGEEETVKLLISKGADINGRNLVEDKNAGKTALGWAKLNKKTKVVQILQEAGAK